MLRQLLVVIKRLFTAGPTAPKGPVAGVPELMLLQIVPVFGAELTAIPIAVVVD